MKKVKLDKEEQDILDSFERGEWKPVANRHREIARYVQYAQNTMAKDNKIYIRVHPKTQAAQAMADNTPKVTPQVTPQVERLLRTCAKPSLRTELQTAENDQKQDKVVKRGR